MAHVTSSRQSTTVHAISLALILIVFFTSPAHSASSIQLTWDPSPASDLGGYNVYMGTTPGSYNTTNNAGLNQSYIFQNLPEGITYYFSATAYDQSGNISEPAEEVSIALPTQGGDITAPSVPSNLQATSLSPTEISLNWTPSTDNVGVTGYTVSRNSTVVASVSTASYIDQGLIPSTTYTYNITAHDAAGNVSAASAPTSAPTKTPNDSTLPLTISNLTVASGQAYVVPASGLQVGSTVYIDRSFTFATVPTNVQGALYIQTANNDKAATNTAFLSFTVNQPVTVYVAHDVRITPKPTWLTNFTDTGKELVTSDTTLHLFARSFSTEIITLGGNAGGGNSMYSIIIQPHSNVEIPDNTPPSTPENLTLVSSSSSEVSIQWAKSTDNVGVTAYDVARDGIVLGLSQTTFFIDSPITSGTTYHYTVKAMDAQGNASEWSVPLKVVVAGNDTTPPSVPQNLTLNSASGTQVALSWIGSTDNVEVTAYNVARDNTVIGTSITTAFVDESTSPGTTYTYTVNAQDAQGNMSAWSTLLQVTTPQALAQLTVSISGNGSITSNPAGINCPKKSCTSKYPHGTVVTMTAKPRNGWSFDGWSGSCTGTDLCTITVTGNMAVKANFSKRSGGRTR